jgi:ADP-ribose pyrophosphatase YjhB (NUDIX family)
MEMRFCPRCATALESRASEPPDPPRPTCPNCGFVHYENPTPTVQAWIDRDGAYLALRRNQDPERGKWNLPGGFVEAGESGPEAIAREVGEETGLEIEIAGLIGIFASTYGYNEDARPILDIAYRCRETGGELEISDESGEHAWFPLAEFPEPAFPGEQQALAALRSADR